MCFSETVVMFVTAATWMTMLVIAVLAVIHPLGKYDGYRYISSAICTNLVNR